LHVLTTAAEIYWPRPLMHASSAYPVPATPMWQNCPNLCVVNI